MGGPWLKVLSVSKLPGPKQQLRNSSSLNNHSWLYLAVGISSYYPSVLFSALLQSQALTLCRGEDSGLQGCELQIRGPAGGPLQPP